MSAEMMDILDAELTENPSGDAKVLINDEGAYKQAEIDKLIQNSQTYEEIGNIKASLSNYEDRGFFSRNLFDAYEFRTNNKADASSMLRYIVLNVEPNTVYICSTDKLETITKNIADVLIGQSYTFSTANNGVFNDSPRKMTSTGDGKLFVAIRNDAISDFLNGNFHIQVEIGETATPYTPYAPSNFEITEIKEDLVDTIKGDLFNGITLDVGQINSTSGADETAPTMRRTKFIDSIPGSQFELSGASQPLRLFEYDSNKTYVKTQVVGNQTFTIGSSTKYIRFHGGQDVFVLPTTKCVGLLPAIHAVNEIKNTLSGYETTISKGLGDIKDTTFDLPIGTNEIKTYLIVCQHQGGANRLICLLTLSFDNNVYRPTITKLLDNANWTIAYANGVLTITNSTATRYSLYSVKRLM